MVKQSRWKRRMRSSRPWESLKAKEGVDTDLAGILTTHILKAAPAPNAVVQAKDAIVKLAAERANPPKVEVANG
ncbi:hypothetical protein HGG75_17650 [Ochrobactrum pseudogrignonense]|nr:hypothetical protein [Brucella pseudogrignonensis]